MDIIYDNHEKEWEKCINDKERRLVAETWMKEGTLDRWRHKRMLSPLKTFISCDTSWLTIGDGRFGTDAHFIISQGGKAHASDISDKLLKIGNEAGFINSFSEENAEQLSFSDNSFDYVLIKEAFHHFPRPWIALYEAFRVCKKGVILIEPRDDKNSIRKMAFSKLGRFLKKLLGKKNYNYDFETVGNFVYRVNPKELEKFLLGMHYRYIATTGVNDYYAPGAEFIDMLTTSAKEKRVIKKAKTVIALRDFLSFTGFSEGLLIATLFKEAPTEQLKELLAQSSWKLKELPKNPYLSSDQYIP